jgi:uncharacterized protein (TIGR02996 family)
MSGDPSTEAAFVQAILANIDDDAPWLIYADWLDENGSDNRARVIREKLQPVRDAVKTGHDLNLVLHYASENRHPVDLPKVERETAYTPMPRYDNEDRHVRSESDSGAKGVFWIIIILLKLAAFGGIASQSRTTSESRVDRDQLQHMTRLVNQSVKDGTAGEGLQRLAGIAKPSPRIETTRWQIAELAGFKLTLVSDQTIRWYSFDSAGIGRGKIGEAAGPVVERLIHWSIDELGVLVIQSADPSETVRLLKVGKEGDRFHVVENRQSFVYVQTNN